MRKHRSALFRGRHFRDEMILLCVRWYLRYSLSYRDIEEMMAERGRNVDHSTIARWVLRFAPVLNERLRRHVRRPAGWWRVDETYVRVNGRWTYLYRAVDSAGDTIEFLLSPTRDAIAAELFCSWRCEAVPRFVHASSTWTVTRHMRGHYRTEAQRRAGTPLPLSEVPNLNHVVEQDHRFIKKRIAASLGFRSIQGALNTIDGYEAMHMIRKGQVRWLPRAVYSANAPSFTLLFDIAA